MNGPSDEEEDFSKLPLDERLSHKSWKARLNGYQQLQKQFQNAFPLPNEYVKYWSDPGHFHKYILDSNVVAQENALFALHAMFGKQIPHVKDLSIFPIDNYINEWLSPLLTKALNSSRNKSKELSITCVMLLSSLDQSIQRVMENVILILPIVRIPKLIASIISCINSLLVTFQLVNIEGPQLIELLNKLFMPLPKLASHADKNVRGNTMDLIVTLYCLLGKDRTLLQETLLDNLKPIQQRELDKKFNDPDLKLGDSTMDCETGEIIMFEWQRRERASNHDDSNDSNNNDELDADGDTNMDINIPSVNKIDPLQLLPEEDLLSNLPEEFHSLIKSTKWKDRVDVLEELNENHLNKIKKLKTKDDYGSLLRILSDIINRDVNVQCVTLAAEAVNSILKKLTRDAIHENYIVMVFPALLERTKERKPSVIEMVIKTIHTICEIYEPFIPGHESLILKDLLIKLNDRIPGVKLECSKLLNELLGRCQIMDHEYMISNLIDGLKIQTTLMKLINDTQMNIRNVSFMIVAKLINLLGIEYFQEFLDGIDKIKRRKIESMINGEEGKVNLKKKGNITGVNTNKNRDTNNTHTNTINRLNKIIPNKRIATSPAIKNDIMNRSPIKNVTSPLISLKKTSPRAITGSKGSNSIGRDRPIRTLPSTTTTIASENHNERGQEDISKLHEKIKQLEESNIGYKNKINELERKINQHINTIMIKDTEIQQLKRQYEVISEQKQHEGVQPQQGPRLEQNQIQFRSGVDVNNSSNNNVDHLPNKVRRLQIDPIRSRQAPGAIGPASQDVPNTTLATEESWQRAAQVTQQLKDRINKMRNRR